LDAALLAHAHGLVCCEQCGQTFDALVELFDERPPVARPAPVAAPVGAVKETAEAAPDWVPEDARSHHRRWLAATVLLVLLTGVNMVWTFRQPLRQVPQINAWLSRVDGAPVQATGLRKDPDQILLLSRDLHAHPTRAGVLVLSLTLVNLAPDKQVYPQLEITLLDAANQPVAQRRFQPREYLRPGAQIAAGLASNAWLPVLLELGDPGASASGFEIRFL